MSAGIASEPGSSVVSRSDGGLDLVACVRTEPRKPCTTAAQTPRDTGWLDIAGARITQTDATTVELSMMLRSAIPKTPRNRTTASIPSRRRLDATLKRRSPISSP